MKDLDRTASRLITDMHRQNSDAALQAAIELMLTDRRGEDVIDALRAWADYLDERI